MDAIFTNPTLKAALDALAELSAARKGGETAAVRMIRAEITHCARSIALHHNVAADDVMYDLIASAPGFLNNMDTPEGLANLGFYYAEQLGGDGSAPLVSVIH